MKRFNKIYLIGCVFLSLLALSCQNELLPNSIGEELIPSTESTSRQIESPGNLKVSRGGKQKISLSWDVVSKATKYYIYASSTPFESFEKIGETSESNFTYNINSGLTRYFKVTAINYKDAESADSVIVKGSSLACPSISSIATETKDTGSSTTVFWYMENVEEYQENVRYEIYCYNGTKQEAFGLVNGAETTVCAYTFENLPQNTNFQFQVTAYLNTAQDETETSIMIDALTAAKQTPDPVTDLKASWAESLDTVTLKFKLPEPSYIKNGKTAGTDTYEQYPLYFKVYRRIKGSELWTKITDHLYCDGTTAGHGSTDQTVINTWFDENFIPGKEVSFKDTGLSNASEYEYKIQSYIDNYKKTDISSDIISVAFTSGHTAANPTVITKDFSYDTTTNTQDGSAIKADGKISFQMSWNSYGKESNYKFVLQTTKTELNSSAEDVKFETFTTLDELNAAEKTFLLVTQDDNTGYFTKDTTNEGYYNFTVYIIEKSADDPTTEAEAQNLCLAKTSTPGKILITGRDGLPTLKGFAVNDGFKDKINIEWEYENSGYQYFLSRYECDSDGNRISDVTNLNNNSAITINVQAGNTFTYTDNTNIKSGCRYVYILTAKDTDLEVPSNPLTGETLGTPNVLFDLDSVKHDSITVSWNDVLKATKYTVDFMDGSTSLGSFVYDTESPSGNDISHNNGIFTCSIQKPLGYDDALKSGSSWTAKITAENNLDSTTGTENVFTLGPKAVKNLTASVAESPSAITVTWDAVPGAKAYAVRRARCDVVSVNQEDSLDSVDVFAFSANGGNVTSNNTIIPAVTAASNNGKIIFTDNVKEIVTEIPTPWEINQDKLAWGFPYKYTVFPLQEGEDLQADAGETTAKIGNVTYSNANNTAISKTGSCIGYGHQVTATKAENPINVSISWKKPYMAGITEPIPTLWFSPSGKNQWQKHNAIINSGSTSAIVALLGENNRTEAFDYAVSYTDGKPINSYISDLSKIKDPLSNNIESINKGYAFAISLKGGNIEKEISTGVKAESMEEYFEWILWDYSKRAVGPDTNSSYKLYIFNNDYSSSNTDWKLIATITQTGNTSTVSINNPSEYNTIIEQNGTNSIKVAPKSLSNGLYDGLLKVLRDPKHYAKLEVTRKEGEITASYNDGKFKPISASETQFVNDPVFGYRTITDTEWIKTTMLAYTQALYVTCGDNGGKWNTAKYQTTTYSNSQGSIRADKDWGTISYTITDWRPVINTKTGNTCRSFLTVSKPTLGETLEAKGTFAAFGFAEDSYTDKLAKTTLTVLGTENISDYTIPSENFSDSLRGTIYVTSTGKGNATISYNRTGTGTSGTLSASNETERRKLIPIRYDGEDHWWFLDSNGTTYGWW
ncbi:MAG: hypothetical protein HUK25_10030 [Treponema sp.]|nr:hypothetical protein [Treponema sp.]